MKRLLSIMVLLATLMPSAAMAADFGEDGNSSVLIENPAYVSGELWASNAGVFATIVQHHSCWYPQEWWDDAVIGYEEGTTPIYNDASRFRDIVESIVNKALSKPDEPRQPPQLFAEIDVFSERSCIQATFVGREDCSTEEMVGVLATAVVRDAYRQVPISIGSFDEHDIGGLYCLVVIEREPWLEIVRDEALIPEPVRATFPQFRTIVGLENQIWYEVAPGVNPTAGGFSVAIPTAGNPYNLSLTVWLTGVRIDIDGDGEWEYDNRCTGDLVTCTGSPDSPIYTFQYETRALHDFTIQTLWAGQAVGPTGEVLNISPGLLLNEHTFGWETVEVRSSLDP